MTWTYTEDPVGISRDAVRLLIGDVVVSEPQISDEAIMFALSECLNDNYAAGAYCCRLIGAKYARLVDTEVDDGGIISKFSQLSKNYTDLARHLDLLGKKVGGGLGLPAAGGISNADVSAAHKDTDRPTAAFGVTTDTNHDVDNS